MILLKCPVKSTEDKQKIKKVLEALFSTKFEEEAGFLKARISEERFKEVCEESNSIAFKELMRDKKIKISKMALFSGRINLEDSHPLGSIEVLLE